MLLGLGQPRRGADDRLVQGEARLPFQLDIFDEVGVSGEVDHSFEVIWWKQVSALDDDFDEGLESNMRKVLDVELAGVGEEAL